MTRASILESVVKPKSRVNDRYRDALSGLQGVIGAEPISEAMTLEQAWRATPDTPALPDEFASSPGPLTLRMPVLKQERLHEEKGRIELAVEGLSVDASDEEIAEALKPYPSLEGAQPVRTLVDETNRSDYQTDRAQTRFVQGRVILTFNAWADAYPLVEAA